MIPIEYIYSITNLVTILGIDPRISLLKLTEIEFFLPFSLFWKVSGLFLHARCAKGAFPLHDRYSTANALSPTARSIDDDFSLPNKCTDGVLREKHGASRPFSKVDEVDVYPYHLGEVEFGS